MRSSFRFGAALAACAASAVGFAQALPGTVFVSPIPEPATWTVFEPGDSPTVGETAFTPYWSDSLQVAPGFVVTYDFISTDPHVLLDPKNWSDIYVFGGGGNVQPDSGVTVVSDPFSNSDLLSRVQLAIAAGTAVTLAESTSSDLTPYTVMNADGTNTTYLLQSDAVPEPASLAGVLTGMGALALLRRRRKA